MAQFVVRNVEDSVAARLKRRAERHGRSTEEEIRQILRNAVREEGAERTRLGSRIAARFSKSGLADPIPELRGQEARPVRFRK